MKFGLYPVKQYKSAPPQSFAVQPGKENIIAVSDGSNDIIILHVDTGEILQCLKGHTGRVLRIAYAPNGILASGSEDGSIKLWKSGCCVHTATHQFIGSYSLLFNQDSTLLYSTHLYNVGILWNVETMSINKLFDLQEIQRIYFSEKSTHLVVIVHYSRLVEIYNVETGQTFDASLSSIDPIIIQNSKFICSMEDLDTLNIYKRVDKVWSIHIPPSSIDCMTFNLNESLFAYYSNKHSKHHIDIYDTDTHAILLSVRLYDITPIRCMAFTCDTSHLITGHYDGSIVIWHMYSTNRHLLRV
jgi:WD40 repeat protein